MMELSFREFQVPPGAKAEGDAAPAEGAASVENRTL
jgi:hypothetical protein